MANHALTYRELSSFFDQIFMLLDAGIPVAEGIGIMREHTPNKETADILDILFAQMDKGKTFSNALSACDCFPLYATEMVAVGEYSGHLDNVCRELSEYYVTRDDVEKSIRSAVRYPLMMLALLVVVLLVMISKVLPVFEEVFLSLGAEMNALATGMISFGNWLSTWAVAVSAVLAVLALGMVMLLRSDHFKNWLRSASHKFFLTKTLSSHLEQARFAQVLSMAMASGIEITRSVEMARLLLTNPLYIQRADQCLEKVQEGYSFGEALVDSNFFGSMDCQFIRIAFKSGNFDTSLRKIAQRHTQLAEEDISKKVAIIEPALVGVFSVVVGVVLFSVIFPLVGIMASFG